MSQDKVRIGHYSISQNDPRTRKLVTRVSGDVYQTVNGGMYFSINSAVLQGLVGNVIVFVNMDEDRKMTPARRPPPPRPPAQRQGTPVPGVDDGDGLYPLDDDDDLPF